MYLFLLRLLLTGTRTAYVCKSNYLQIFCNVKFLNFATFLSSGQPLGRIRMLAN